MPVGGMGMGGVVEGNSVGMYSRGLRWWVKAIGWIWWVVNCGLGGRIGCLCVVVVMGRRWIFDDVMGGVVVMIGAFARVGGGRVEAGQTGSCSGVSRPRCGGKGGGFVW
jgi:hypothetical protein